MFDDQTSIKNKHNDRVAWSYFYIDSSDDATPSNAADEAFFH